MSWKKSSIKEEKQKFLNEWLKKEFTFKELCERYEISRKTGYKLVNQFKESGEGAFEKRSCRRHHHPNAVTQEIQKKLLSLKYRYSNWGPAKIRDWLLLDKPTGSWPASSTIGEILKRHGLVRPRKKRKHVPAYTEPFSACTRPNQVWSADFKGQFLLGDKSYCYPLTITDNYSRYLFLCEGLKSPNTKEVIKLFEKIFKKHGLPEAIRTDNGQPFAGLGIGALTRLSIWCLKLGICFERIAPGHPEQNGRHERMHRTLKEATALPAKRNRKAQQRCFEVFQKEYNEERPHRGLAGKRPKDVYEKSDRIFPKRVPEIRYSKHMEIRRVKINGMIKWCGKSYYVSELLHGESVGLEIIDEGRAIVHFAKLKLGVIDVKTHKIIRV